MQHATKQASNLGMSPETGNRSNACPPVKYAVIARSGQVQRFKRTPKDVPHSFVSTTEGSFHNLGE